MEIEKTLQVQAPREAVWKLLLDPHVMTGAVPGMQSIDVISPTEYVAQMRVKISFISAKFKLHTRIVEQREPEYLRVEGTGEDTSVASSLKQSTEVFLASTPEGGTELRIKAKVDVLGRLGTFGLSVMKTKADRLWEEFGENLANRIDNPETADKESAAATATAQSATPAADASNEAASAAATAHTQVTAPPSPAAPAAQTTHAEPRGWFARLVSGNRPAASSGTQTADTIRIEVRRLDQTITIDWPVSAASQCKEWLEGYLEHSTSEPPKN